MRDPQSSSLSNACRRNCVRELHREAPRFQCLPSSVGLLEAFWRMIGGSPCLCCPANVQLSLVSLLSARPKSPRCQALNMLENKRHARTSFETFWRIKMQIYLQEAKNFQQSVHFFTMEITLENAERRDFTRIQICANMNLY